MKPAVSVIIPTYNYGKYINECIESVYNQTYKNFEIIIIDDGSTDHTKEIVLGFNNVRYFYQDNSGEAAARNRGLKEAQGNFIAFIDADDKWDPEKLKLQVDYMRICPDCNILYGNYIDFCENKQLEVQNKIQKALAYHTKECLPTALIRKMLFDKYGFFDETITYGTDVNWMLRIKNGGEDTSHYIDQVVYYRRLHGENMILTKAPTTGTGQGQLMAQILRSNYIKRRRTNE